MKKLIALFSLLLCMLCTGFDTTDIQNPPTDEGGIQVYHILPNVNGG